MAIKTFVTGSSTATIADNDTTIVGGTGGSEKIKILSGVTGVTTDANIEKVDLSGSLADYKFVFVAGSGVQIQTTAGAVIGTIPSLNQNALVAFSDGSATLTQTGSTAFALGSAAIGTTAAAITTATLGATFDTAVKSTVNPATNGTAGAGQTFTLTSSVDNLVGTTGSDTFTGTAANYSNSDQIVDSSTTDSDSYNLALSGSATPKSTNVELVNLTISTTNGTNPQITASSLSGVKNLTVTGTDLAVGGSSIAGDKDVDVTALNAESVLKVTAGASTVDVTVVQATKAGATVDASTATGAIAVTGSATVSADLATGTVVMTKLNDTTEDAKAVTVNAALSSSVTTADTGFTGLVTFNAAKASTITILNATGGAVVNGGTTSTADTTIRVDNIDSSGAIITSGTGSSVVALKQIAVNLDGTSASTDVATVSAAGYISLDANTTDLVETVNLSGSTAAVTYAMVSSAPTTYNLTGSQNITISNTAAALTGMSLTDTTTAGTTTLSITSGDDADLSGIAADLIDLADDGTSADYTVATGSNIQLSADQTDLTIIGKVANSTVNITTADDTAANGTTIDLSVGAFVASSNVKALNINATVGKFTATTTTLDIAGDDATTLTITGTKAVTLGTTIAKTINASALTGVLSLTISDNASSDISLTSGLASDVIVVNEASAGAQTVTVNAGNGNNTLTITDANAASSFSTGTGTDTVNLNHAAAFVIVTGSGDDTVKIGHNIDADSIVVGGDGTDTLTFLDTDGNDSSDNTNFSFAAFENLNIAALTSSAITIKATQFGGQTFTLTGTSGGSDKLIIKDTATGASTITAENVILADALLEIQGGAGNDTITGSAYADLLDGGVGSDLLMGGDGSDTYVAVTTIDATTAEVEGTGTGVQSGMVINLSASAITNTTILSAMTAYTADTVTSVASNSAVHIYGTSASTNSAAVDTLAAIENVTGSAGADYIVGSVSANTISGGAGADYIIGGLGADTITIGSGANVIVQLTGASGAATASLADTITDFTAATAAIEIGTYTGDVSGGAADNYVEVPDAAYANYAAVLTALNTAAATLAGNSTATLIVVFAGDTTGTDNGYVGIDRDGGGTIDEVIILTGIVAAGISVADIT